jgi:hypothetical protein
MWTLAWGRGVRPVSRPWRRVACEFADDEGSCYGPVLSTMAQVDDSDYGYFWWRPWHNVEMPNGPERVYIGAAQGNGGQKIFVLPEYDFVAVFTAGSYNAGGSAPNRIMNTVVLPRLLAAHGGKSLATK